MSINPLQLLMKEKYGIAPAKPVKYIMITVVKNLQAKKERKVLNPKPASSVIILRRGDTEQRIVRW
jgi:hypothetical protein